jgi:Co/Zn/Cd efflux system component
MKVFKTIQADSSVHCLCPFRRVMQHVRANTPGNRATLQPKPTQALNYSFISNLVLLGVRVAVAVLSQSLALMVTTLDAVLDVIRYGTWASQERAVV